MNKSMMTSIIIYSLAAPVFSNAGKLSDFASGASGSSGGGNSGSGHGSWSSNSNDDDCGLMCALLKAIFTPNNTTENAQSKQGAPVTMYNTPYVEPVYTRAPQTPSYAEQDTADFDSLAGKEFTLRGSYGYWGDHLYGDGFDASFSWNVFVLDVQTLFDHEGIGSSQDSMQTVMMRMGLVYPGKNNWVTVLFGLSTLTHETTTTLSSFGLRHEYRSGWWGTRLEGNLNLDDNHAGFYDLYGGMYLRKGPVLFELGLKRRSTLQDVSTVIEGPQVGITIRFGSYHK